MASRRKEPSAAVQEMRRLQRIGAEQMEQHFNNWVLKHHTALIDIVMARAADEKQTIEEACYGIFLDCMRFQQHGLQIKIAEELEAEGRAEEDEAA